MKTKKTLSPPMVGGSSLLIIFAVLCLTVFALLTISTAQADKRLSEVSADAISSYYSADFQAEVILAQLRRGELPDGVQVNESVYSYACPISDTQTLMVEVFIEQGSWQILRWQSVSSNQ